MPKLIILDEPNSNLDEDGDLALANTINVCKSRGSTVVVMTHRSSILEVADKVMVLKGGQIVTFGPRDQVFQKRPQEPNAKQNSSDNETQPYMTSGVANP